MTAWPAILGLFLGGTTGLLIGLSVGAVLGATYGWAVGSARPYQFHSARGVLLFIIDHSWSVLNTLAHRNFRLGDNARPIRLVA